MTAQVFLLSPASCTGKSVRLLLERRTTTDLAARLQSHRGVPIAEVFEWISGLYFRGKLAYARAFADPPAGCAGVQVITPGRGLLPSEETITLDELHSIAAVSADPLDRRFREPLVRHAEQLAEALGERDRVVLLGSVATGKYLDPLLQVLGGRLHVVQEFIGRGSLSRGGLLLRCVAAREQLTYVPAAGAPRHGKRPPRLPRRRSEPS